jgi:predicted transcriptional regulator
MMDLRARRTALHLSQSRLARLSGVSRFKICLHEMGDKTLSAQDLERVETAIRREAQRLHGLTEPIAAGHDPQEAA